LASLAQLQLIGAQLLGATAKLMAQQMLDQPLQLVDFNLVLLHRGLQHRVPLLGRRDHCAQQILQRGRIIRQGGEVDWHAIILARWVVSRPMNLA
jgi:hypothetical protein